MMEGLHKESSQSEKVQQVKAKSNEGRQTGGWMDESVLLLFGYAMIELTSVFCNDGDRLIDKNQIPVEANNP